MFTHFRCKNRYLCLIETYIRLHEIFLNVAFLYSVPLLVAFVNIGYIRDGAGIKIEDHPFGHVIRCAEYTSSASSLVPFPTNSKIQS